MNKNITLVYSTIFIAGMIGQTMINIMDHSIYGYSFMIGWYILVSVILFEILKIQKEFKNE